MNRIVLILLNICLAGIVCLLALKVYNVWNDMYALPTTVEQVSVEPHNARRQIYTKARKTNDNYNIIVEKDLFSENRNLNEEKASLTPSSQMVLYGCFVYGEHKAALLELQEEKGEKVRRGMAAKQVTVGDTIAGYQVTNILEDKVVLKDEAGKTCIVQIEIPKERSNARTEVSKTHEMTTPKRGTSHKTATKSRPTRDSS